MTIEQYIGQMTLEEKAAMLQGWTTWTSCSLERLNIPAIFMSDGPHGLRKQKGAADHLGLNESVPATCFPTAATMANTWDVALGEELGRALGEEAAANDVHVVLGPGLNMKRSPLCGRNFEYFSEDPYLAGKMAAAYVRGIQLNGVAACPKHFAVNSQELRRMSMDSVVDERTLREIYLTGFEIAVKEGHAKSIMSSYNQINGTYANENAHLLDEILRGEWGFDGFVVTDWGADNDHTEGVRAGCNVVMPAPGPDCAIGLVKAVREGRIAESVLDKRIAEFLSVALPACEQVAKAPKSFDVQAHHDIARRCAQASIVLLDNDGILPLAPDAEVAVIGDFAKSPRYQGAGSSVVNPTRLDNLLDCAKAAGLKVIGFAQGFSRTEPEADQKLIAEAVALAEKAKTVLLCIGLDEISESEGMDRTSMKLSRGQLALIDAVCAASSNVVLVISGGSPFEMPERSRYRAAIHGYLGGQAGAGAMIDALTGVVNPGGKLNETWPLKLEDNPSHPYFPSKERTAEYREGLLIGYRYYDTAEVPVRYPFGYGLSYTSFEYADVAVKAHEVTFTLENTGKADGWEVAQVYVSCPGGYALRPRKELKGFARVFLRAGEKQRVTIPLDDKAFRYYNVLNKRWETEAGEYEVCVAANVNDVRLRGRITLAGLSAKKPSEDLAPYRTGDIRDVSDKTFRELLGRSIPNGQWSGDLGKNDAICQMYYAKSPVARLLYKLLTYLKKKADAKGKPDINIMFIYNMPFRAIGKMAGGMVSEKMVDDILFIVNGHFFRGMGRLIADFLRNHKASAAFVKKLRG